jgi:Cell division septal protein
MKKRLIIAAALLVLLTTINTKQEIIISKFNIKEIRIDNNFILKDKELKKLLSQIYDKNLIFLSNNEIEKSLMKNNFIESFKIKKIYPNTLKIKIYEKKPIAILFKKKKKFYLSKKMEIIQFRKIKNYRELPYVFGNEKNFKKFYTDLKKIDFPFNIIQKYTLFEFNRWDIETVSDKLIKLPPENYLKSLKNFLDIRNKNNFKKYKVFDYRIENQLILK